MNRVVVPARQATYAGGINSLESIPRLLKGLKIPYMIACSRDGCLLVTRVTRYINTESHLLHVGVGDV